MSAPKAITSFFLQGLNSAVVCGLTLLSSTKGQKITVAQNPLDVHIVNLLFSILIYLKEKARQRFVHLPFKSSNEVKK